MHGGGGGGGGGGGRRGMEGGMGREGGIPRVKVRAGERVYVHNISLQVLKMCSAPTSTFPQHNTSYDNYSRRGMTDKQTAASQQLV